MTDALKDEFLTPHEAARLKGVTRSAIYTAIAEGRLPRRRFLGRLALKRSDLAEWVPMPNSGRPKGIVVTDRTKQRMSLAQRRRRAVERGKAEREQGKQTFQADERSGKRQRP